MLLLLISVHGAVCFLGATRIRIDSTVCPIRFVPAFRRSQGDTLSTTLLASGHPDQQSLEAEDNTESNKSFLARWYDKCLDLNERRPYPTKAISECVIVGLGAMLSQWIQAMATKTTPLVMDWHLIRSFALTGLLFEGPAFRMRRTIPAASDALNLLRLPHLES